MFLEAWPRELIGHQDIFLGQYERKGAAELPMWHLVLPSQELEESGEEVRGFGFLSKAQRLVMSCLLPKSHSEKHSFLLPHVQKRAMWVTA